MKGRDTLPLHAQLPWFGFAPLADGEVGLRTMLAKSGELLAVTGVLAIALLAFPCQAAPRLRSAPSNGQPHASARTRPAKPNGCCARNSAHRRPGPMACRCSSRSGASSARRGPNVDRCLLSAKAGRARIDAARHSAISAHRRRRAFHAKRSHNLPRSRVNWLSANAGRPG